MDRWQGARLSLAGGINYAGVVRKAKAAGAFQQVLPISFGFPRRYAPAEPSGRQAPVCHLASLRQPATGALPAANQTECRTSLCLGGPISRLSPCWTALLEATAHRTNGGGFHPLRRAHLQYDDLQAFLVMANHVHLLARPRVNPSRFLQTLKGYTAREANRMLGRTGQPFWQGEFA